MMNRLACIVEQTNVVQSNTIGLLAVCMFNERHVSTVSLSSSQHIRMKFEARLIAGCLRQRHELFDCGQY